MTPIQPRRILFPTGAASVTGAFLLSLMVAVCLFAATGR